MTNSKLSLREQKIFAACFLVILIYVSIQFVFRPLDKKILALQAKAQTLRKHIAKNLKVARQDNSVDSEYNRHAQNFKQKVSDEGAMTSILSEIESTANEVSMRLSDMKPKKTKRIDFYNTFSVSLTMEGEITSIIHFIYVLENAPHFFTVDDLQLEKSSSRTSQIKCRMVLSKILIP